MILGLNTGYGNVSIGLSTKGEVLASESSESWSRSLESLQIHIDSVLSLAKVSISELTGIGVVVGPGSYTSLRLGVVTAKTMAQVLGVPICAIPTYEALLSMSLPLSGVAVVLIPARGDEYAVSIYDCDGSDISCRVENKLYSESQLIEEGLGLDGERFFIGTLPSALKDVVLDKKSCRVIESGCLGGGVLASMADARLREGGGVSYTEVVPIYMGPPVKKAGVSKKQWAQSPVNRKKGFN
ncbi:tRNA (adenosine(37)-N6)-threonylcarbamoyltransferase complex dimerization subunit type 1 TsaB [Candidatus Marinamargulisbacteria bacterium SCGC AG-439-L15]|nr:tRNA (adenosine(37)-N6)-threonylcarbamoyltransferase complex dimerization subunit type 1 TsaB [Candidatus Marinamargulisbacteria bacterium SCGC AG-439-L15]